MHASNSVLAAQRKMVCIFIINLYSIICVHNNLRFSLYYAISDACVGDSGGPWMQVASTDNGPRYFLTGVVSMGPKKCGAGIGVYTRIAAHMKYILDRLN